MGRIGFFGGRICALVPWLGPLVLAGCLVESVDLRGPDGGDVPDPGDPQCGIDERWDPTMGACAPCQRREPRPEDQCPCGFTPVPQPFPFCDEIDADYACDACPAAGSIQDCTAFNSDGSVRSCAQLAACCGQLLGSPTPCCLPSEELSCALDVFERTFDYAFDCIDQTCCEASCTLDDDCELFQTCVGSRCKPGCGSGTFYCDSTCTCVEGLPPL